jgi:hypothetical protein
MLQRLVVAVEAIVEVATLKLLVALAHKFALGE